MKVIDLKPVSTDRIMNSVEISTEKFRGKKSPRWVREHIPDRLEGSREALWFESTVDRYLETLRKTKRVA